jgi:hypothetical protein
MVLRDLHGGMVGFLYGYLQYLLLVIIYRVIIRALKPAETAWFFL